MRYVTAEPAGALRTAITRVWFLSMRREHLTERILPMPTLQIIVNLSEPYRVFGPASDRSGDTAPPVFLTGLRHRVIHIGNPEHIRHLGVELPVYGASRFGLVASDSVRPVDGELGLALERIRQAARTDPLHDRDVQPLLAATLCALQRCVRPETEAQRSVRTAVARLTAEPTTAIGSIAAGLGMSHKTLVDRFHRVTGTTPLRIARLITIHRLLERVPPAGPMPTWTELVAESPYVDQSHFIRSFKHLIGMTPRDYLAALGASRYDDQLFLGSDDPR